jgi:hypothetical protein
VGPFISRIEFGPKQEHHGDKWLYTRARDDAEAVVLDLVQPTGRSAPLGGIVGPAQRKGGDTS